MEFFSRTKLMISSKSLYKFSLTKWLNSQRKSDSAYADQNSNIFFIYREDTSPPNFCFVGSTWTHMSIAGMRTL